MQQVPNLLQLWSKCKHSTHYNHSCYPSTLYMQVIYMQVISTQLDTVIFALQVPNIITLQQKCSTATRQATVIVALQILNLVHDILGSTCTEHHTVVIQVLNMLQLLLHYRYPIGNCYNCRTSTQHALQVLNMLLL